MLKVHRTDTDEIVLIHEPTQTVVVGDSFDAAFEKMRQHLGERLDDPLAPPADPAPGRDLARPTAWARYALLAVLVALPFVWLAVLHASLGGLVVELRRSVAEPGDVAAEAADDPELREDLDALGRRVDRLIDDVSKLKRDAKRRSAKPEPIDDEDDDDEGEGEDDDDDEEPGAKTPAEPAVPKAPEPK